MTMTVTETAPTTPEIPAAPGTPGVPRRPRFRGPRAAILIAGTTAVLLAVLVATLVVVGFDRGSGSAPYGDDAATGRLTLCDASGHAVTSGSVGDALATVVGETPVGGDAAPGATATLFAYQPREGTGASEWTGLALSAPGAVDAATVTLRLGDDSTTLAQFLAGYPATWDGWVQLRLVVASPDAGVAPTYDAVDVRVDGDHWRAAEPGTATCPA
jgi:hypothetical protein